uniref:Uncharacterized protein n=1 Tax=Caenorhabditis japonica TaxID=281687 RepID=A0A8R1IA71_CAEJA
MLDCCDLFIWGVPGSNRTSHPLCTIVSKQIKFRFIAPDMFCLFFPSPVEMCFSPRDTNFLILLADERRLLIVLLDGAGSIGLFTALKMPVEFLRGSSLEERTMFRSMLRVVETGLPGWGQQ